MSNRRRESRARELERFSADARTEAGSGSPAEINADGAGSRPRRVSTRSPRESAADTAGASSGRREAADRRAPGRKRVIRLRSAVLAVLAAAVISAALAYFAAYKKAEQQYIYSRQPVIVEEGEALQTIRTGLEQGEPVLTSVRRGFKNYMVVPQGGRYLFVPIDFDLKMHSRSGENVKKVTDTTWEYREEDRTVSYKGIDVSSHQGGIRWDQVAGDGVEFALIRSVYRGYESGKLVTDERFMENAEGAAENGIAIGAYLFSQAINEKEMDEEVDLLLENIAPYPVTCPVVLDIERTGSGSGRADSLSVQERTDLAKHFCERIRAAGYTPMLYYNFEAAMMLIDLKQLEEYEKWYATYSTDFYYPYYYTVWQYTSTGRVNGIEGDVDMDMSFEKFW